MTPTEKGRRVDALNQGPDTRRVLCEMVANREADLEDARAENAKLQNDAELLRAMLSQVQTEKRCYMAENDKLRELLQRLLAEYRYLRVRPRKTYLQHEGRMRAIEEEMRELGVEVE